MKSFKIDTLHKIIIIRNCYISRAESCITDELIRARKPFPKKKYRKGTILKDVRPFASENSHNGYFSVTFTDIDGKNYTTYHLPENCFEFAE